MLKREWVDLTGYDPTDSDWDVISTVYTFHPAIPEVGGKDILANLYKLGGMGVLHELLPSAEEVCELEKNVNHHTAALRDAQDRLQAARGRYRPLRNLSH